MARIVLLADDSVTAQNMGRRIMTDAGYEVITVNNGSAALKKIHESHPDLIVLDVYMPGYGGLEVCQRLKESEATMKIPVLLTVGKMEPFKTEEAKRVHADGHIIKPFDASELLAALTRLEDKIVPSENGRGRRGKTETGAKRPRTGAVADPAATFDDSHTEQIEYLSRVKQRSQADEVPETSDSAVVQPAAKRLSAIDDPEATVEMPAMAKSSSYEPRFAKESPAPAAAPDEHNDTVTFASGPIYEPDLNASASAVTEPIEKFETQAQAELATPVRDAEYTSSQSSETSEVDSAPSGIEKVFSGTQTDPVAAFSVETGIGHDASADFSPTPDVEPAQRWIAENVEHTSEEAARSLEEEMRQANALGEAPESDTPSQKETSPQTTTAQEPEWQPQSAPESDPASGAAFAAAASASDSFAQTNAVSLSSPESEPSAGSESSAAWDNWQRIRDTVITDRATEAIAAAAMADIASSSQTEAPAAEPATATVAPLSEGDALANIVDNVLAELKPRLLAEIAKQLANGKK